MFIAHGNILNEGINKATYWISFNNGNTWEYGIMYRHLTNTIGRTLTYRYKDNSIAMISEDLSEHCSIYQRAF